MQKALGSRLGVKALSVSVCMRGASSSVGAQSPSVRREERTRERDPVACAGAGRDNS